MTDPFKVEMKKTPVWARMLILFVLYWAFFGFVALLRPRGMAVLFSYPSLLCSLAVSFSGMWTYAWFMRVFDRINKYISRP